MNLNIEIDKYGTGTMISATLAVLKLGGILNMSWWYVFTPFYIMFPFIMLSLILQIWLILKR